ncbi:hypothetical protein OE88DRAFT_1737055 [Heliocybe sulcata]|uniref:Uncharacterized protein n=1 Tax=Heliocybe sulcata TaxID=5364 RepID=A0A5C3MX33_9AGAM|nr:hypothetical protein OE88DRAFT_1737055 [Heliocybe sulcata]
MHLPALNVLDLLLPLWRGSWDKHDKQKDPPSNWDWATLSNEDTWQEHRHIVSENKKYLPTSFGRAPRNPATKLNSGFKAIEFVNYFYGMGPGVFYEVLPDNIWRHFCQLVSAVRTLSQRQVTRQEIEEAHISLIQWEQDYEELYYQRLEYRIPLVRPVCHTLTHLAAQTFVWGPLACSSQWIIENAIGFLGRLVRQPSNAFANLTEVTLRHARTAALQAIIPGLVPERKHIATGGIDIGDQYAFLPARDTNPRRILAHEAAAVCEYLRMYDNSDRFLNYDIQLHRWSKARLPNGQIARSAWRETLRTRQDARISRNVKVRKGHDIFIAEVLFYMKLDNDVDNIPPECPRHCALVTRYSEPHPVLKEMSHGTLLSCLHGGEDGLMVINAKDILSVVAMIPHRPTIPGESIKQDRFYLVEKPVLAMDELAGLQDEENEGN